MGKISPRFNIYENKALLNFWHNMAQIYTPIKEEFYKEAKIKWNQLFKRSKNILGILIRGTDYINLKPKNHPIQPIAEKVISDTINMDSIYKYDYIFITTEDDLIREKFIKAIGGKLKYIKGKNINYDFKRKKYLSSNKNVNLSYMKVYLINIIIFSKCIDIITSKSGGSLAAFIISKGFRNFKVYNLGFYK